MCLFIQSWVQCLDAVLSLLLQIQLQSNWKKKKEKRNDEKQDKKKETPPSTLCWWSFGFLVFGMLAPSTSAEIIIKKMREKY